MTCAVLAESDAASPADDSSSQTAVTATGAPASSTPVVRGASGNKPASAVKSISLVGRIEELRGKGASLPISLTLKGLKSQQAQIDPTSQSPVKGGSLVTFPPGWLGNWGGTLVADYVTNVRDAVKYKRGDKALVIFSFAVEGNRVALKPAKLYLPPRMERAGDAMLVVDDLHKPIVADPNAVHRMNVVLPLGNVLAKTLDGNVGERVVVLNTLKQLSLGVVEQDIVTQSYSVRDGQTTGSTYEETVVRFRAYREGVMYCNVAHATYLNSRTPALREFFDGWVTRDWRRTERELERQTGHSASQLGFPELENQHK